MLGPPLDYGFALSRKSAWAGLRLKTKYSKNEFVVDLNENLQELQLFMKSFDDLRLFCLLSN